MNRKKCLSLLLAICMVLALLPTVAMAEAPVADTLNRELTGVADGSTTYTDWTYTSTESGAVYAGLSAGGNDSIQLRSKNNNSGIVTTVSGGKATKIAVTWNSNNDNGRTLDIYGKNSAYSSAADLYNSSTQGTKLGSLEFNKRDTDNKTTLTISGDYEYIGMRSQSGAMYLDEIEITWSQDGDTPPAPTYTVSFDANGGTGTMANVTTASPYTLPACGFTAPEGKEFDYWTVDGDEGMYAPGNSYTLTGNTTFIAQWKDLPVVNDTDMMLKRVPENGDTVVIYYPKASKVMTGEDYLYNNKKHELVAADATLTDNVLAVPDEAVRLMVSVADGKYTFATADGKYLEADGTNVQLVSAQSANTLFQLETAAAGTDNYYIKCDSATFSGSAQYIEYYGGGYFTVYSMNTSNPGIFTFQFFSENGEGPTPETMYTVTLNPGEAGGDPQTIEDVTSPYTLPDCPFTAPEGKVFNGWQADNDDVYAAGTEVELTDDASFTATWKDLVARTYELVTSTEGLVDGGTYLIASEIFADELYLMSNQTSNNRAQYKVTGVEGTTLTLDESWIATAAADALAFEFTLEAEGNNWAFRDEVTGGYLYAASSSSNWLRTETELDDNGKFSITFEDDGATVPVAQGENTRGYMHYNGESACFSCYAESSHITAAVYLYKLVEDAPAAEPTFASQNLILDGLIGVSFNMDLPEIEGVDYSTSYMTFSVPHGTCTERVDYSASKLKKSSQTQAFVCYVTAVMMAEPITATFHYTQNGTEKTVEKVYAVKDYFKAYDEKQAQFDPKTQTLIESVADYGHHVQAFLAAQKGWTFGENGDYFEMDKSYTESYDSGEIATVAQEIAFSCTPDGTPDFRKLSFALVCDSATEMRILFRVASGYIGTLTATVDGTAINVTELGTSKAVQIANIPAHMLSESHTIVITTGNGSATITASALAYVKVLLSAYPNNANATNAAAAIYGYSAAADAYMAN